MTMPLATAITLIGLAFVAGMLTAHGIFLRDERRGVKEGQ